MNKKKLLPSRIKYDKNKPTVSARMSKEEREKLLSVLEKLKLTLPQLLTSFADETEIKLKPIDQAMKEGYEAGYRDAVKKFGVPFACAKCGALAYITSPKSKEIVGRFMTERGGCHAECPKIKDQVKIQKFTGNK